MSAQGPLFPLITLLDRNSLMWSIEPAQNFPKNFLAPSIRRSWITNGHKCNTLFLLMRSRFSTTTTLAPSNWASIAARKPHGPAPIIKTYKKYIYIIIHSRRSTQCFYKWYNLLQFWSYKSKIKNRKFRRAPSKGTTARARIWWGEY